MAVRAASLGFRELLVLRGQYVLPVKPDVVPVSDGAGEVVAVGPDVERVRPGDRVAAALFPRWLDGPLQPHCLPQLGGSLDGMLTELAVLPEEALVSVPDHLSYAEAATLPCAAVTAWNALTGDGRGVRRGQTVLTTGSGGVSLFTVQFAELLGAKVIATTGRTDKEQRLRDLGADEVVNYRDKPNWHTAVRELTGGRGVDRVVDTAGTLEQSLKSLAMDGHVAFVGSVTAAPATDRAPSAVRRRRDGPGRGRRQSRPVHAHERSHLRASAPAGRRPGVPVRRSRGGLPLLRVGHAVRKGRHRHRTAGGRG